MTVAGGPAAALATLAPVQGLPPSTPEQEALPAQTGELDSGFIEEAHAGYAA